jgi:hypothetical protein
MQGPYEQPINSNFPGFFVILIDQSKSMDEGFGETQKHVFAANVINKVIYEIRSAAQEGTEIKDRCFVVVIGYGAETKALIAQKTSELKSKIIRVEQRKFTQKDGSQIDLRMPIWLEPKAVNGTPMDAAFDLAFNLTSGFCSSKPESFPPIVINITDGVPNDLQHGGKGERTRDAARRLLTLKTRHGELLLFNAHIGNYQLGPVLLPNEKSQLNDPYAQYLFDFTSPIPKPMFKLAEMVGFSPKPGARGMVFNADADGLIKLLNFGGSKAIYD